MVLGIKIPWYFYFILTKVKVFKLTRASFNIRCSK